VREGKTPEEDILGLLDRLESDYTQARTLEECRNMLKAELGYDRPVLAEAIWSALPTKTTQAEMGIRGVNVKYPWGWEHRYGIQGIPGLWGWAAVSELMEAEAGEW